MVVRHARQFGTRNGRCKLTDDEVDLIRELYEEDRFKSAPDRFWTTTKLSEKFEVSRKHVARIVSYQQRLAPADV